MLHASLVSTLLCCVYTLRCFYMFFWTNLLTRCHSASCLFSSVFGSRKGKKSIFSKLDGTKARIRDRGEPPGATPLAAWLNLAHAWGGVRPPWLPPSLASSPIYTPRYQNPKHPINIPRNCWRYALEAIINMVI